MDFYWRLKNIPELRGVPEKDRRRKWSEAVSRSHTARGMLAIFLLFGAGFIGGDLIARWSGHATGWINMGSILLGAMLAGMVNAYGLIQPRARRWLQDHR
jgi:hypothetical protein